MARFGLFGTRAQLVHNNALNYAGVLLTLLSGFMFVFAYSSSDNDETTEASKIDKSAPPTVPESNYSIKERHDSVPRQMKAQQTNADGGDTFDLRPSTAKDHRICRMPRLTPRKAFFIGFAVFLGCFHGLMMTPIVYVQVSIRFGVLERMCR